ncbi:hypothetical protein [Neomoorella humiferrea]|uniref:hypothetical protein n=1 Tax=Neomoorella humiferrea TaxID=676965 RepID=UPI0030CC832A
MTVVQSPPDISPKKLHGNFVPGGVMEGNSGEVGRNVIGNNFKGANRGENFFQIFTIKAYNPPPPPIGYFYFLC